MHYPPFPRTKFQKEWHCDTQDKVFVKKSWKNSEIIHRFQQKSGKIEHKVCLPSLPRTKNWKINTIGILEEVFAI